MVTRQAKRRCAGGGEVYDDSYREWRYRDGIPQVKCQGCDARRTPRIVRITLCPGAYELQLRFPYHTEVTR